jgi:DNA-binding NarL/FixJ family response regulator
MLEPRPSSPPCGLTAARAELDGREVLVLSFPYESPLALDRLTRTEREIVLAILTGASNAEIASDRGTTMLTVAKQIASALRKLGVRSRGELAAIATRSAHV